MITNEFSIVMKSIEYTLNDLYKNGYIKLNILEKRKYDNTLKFIKETGFKVLRNSEGIHKLNINTERMQNIINDEEKQRKFAQTYPMAIQYVYKL